MTLTTPPPNQWILGDKFDSVHPHLESIEKLWNLKWKFPCSKSLYPFHDGAFSDFAPIFETLIAKNIHSGYTDEYTQEFLPTASQLVSEGDELSSSDSKQASEIYLRACAVYRIARFPYINSALKRQVYSDQKRTYLKAAALWSCPIEDISIPFTAATTSDSGAEIPIYLRLPATASTSTSAPASAKISGEGVPVVLLLCGLDGHRPDNTTRSDEFLKRGWASVIVDIPGTADCPADRRDPRSAERLFGCVLEWIKDQPGLDEKRVVAWGLSAGGYNAVRLAHTHPTSLLGAIAQGAGTHHFFSRAWLSRAQNHEYPWNALPALTEKFGYADAEEFMEKAQKTWSLVENRVVERGLGRCRLLLVNGMEDGLMPIEDSMLLFEYGSPKEARFVPGRLHMGYPEANGFVYPWMEQVMAAAL
ncbi:hypothetical protein M8818_001954 [Zalaria obscura]|uniref:Uncharacterized protein n=1 Tax=Zalaria obscura TaxID=2024903 RepID=A0ACC3SKI4_9PEZI